jgi:hypothetical protein
MEDIKSAIVCKIALLAVVLGVPAVGRADLLTVFTYLNVDGHLSGPHVTNPRPGQFSCLINCIIPIPPRTGGLVWIGPSPEATAVDIERGAVSFGVPVFDDFVETVDSFSNFHINPTSDGIVMELYLFQDVPHGSAGMGGPCTLFLAGCQTVVSGQTYQIGTVSWSDGSVDRFQYQYIMTPEPGSVALLGTALALAICFVRRR